MDERRVIGVAIFAFILSRVIVFAALITVAHIAFLQKASSTSVWETRIELQRERVLPELSRMVMIGDAWWYRSIAIDGYSQSAHWPTEKKAAFFPLFPLLVKALGVSGEFSLDAIMISNLAFLAGLIVTGLLALRWGLSADDSSRAVFYLAFFPTSYFFSLPLTESVFLLLSVGSIFAATRGLWWGAGLCGALAAFTRFPGILLAPALVLLAWQHYRKPVPQMLWTLLVPLGTATFMLHLYQVAGNALAFVVAQRRWGREPAPFWEPLFGYLKRPALVGDVWNLLGFNFLVAVLLLGCAGMLLSRRDWTLGFYTLAMVLLPLSSGSLQSMARYAVVVFPLFFWLAVLGRSPMIDRTIVAVSLSGFGWFLALFALRVDFALA